MAPRAGSTTTNGGTDFRLTPLTGRWRSDSDGATPRSHGEDESTGSARHSGVGSGSSKATDGSWKAKKPGAASGSVSYLPNFKTLRGSSRWDSAFGPKHSLPRASWRPVRTDG